MLFLGRKKLMVATCALLLGQSFSWAEMKPLAVLLPFPTEVQSTKPTIQAKLINEPVRSITVPPDTIINVKLTKPLATNHNQSGETVTAQLTTPLFIGPYLVAPEGAKVTGKITDLNRVAIKKGPNPFIVVDFYELQCTPDEAALPFQGTLIAYRTDFSRKDYVWRIPTPHSALQANLNSMLSGAAYGLMVNPIFGAPVGAGFGLLKSIAINKVASRGTIKIDDKEVVPLSVQTAFNLPLIEIVPLKAKQAPNTSAKKYKKNEHRPEQAANH